MSETKRNWYEGIRKRMPEENRSIGLSSPFDQTFPSFAQMARKMYDLSSMDFLEDIQRFGFQDKGDHYELVTDLGEHDANESEVNIELDGSVVTISFEHTTKDAGRNNFYSHSQKTSVTLPEDADEKTIEGTINENGDVVVTVEKKTKKNYPSKRTIPIKQKKNEELF